MPDVAAWLGLLLSTAYERRARARAAVRAASETRRGPQGRPTEAPALPSWTS